MAGLTLDDLDPTYTPGAGPSGHTLLYPPDGVTGIAPVDLNTSMGTLQRQLFQQNQVLHDMKQAFDAQVLSLQAEQQRVQQDNVHLLHRLNTLPTPMSSGSPSRLDCPTFGAEDKAVDSKLGLHQFHAWRVQVVAWHAESTLAVSTRNVQIFTKLRGPAARVVAAKMPLDALRTDQGFQGLLGILDPGILLQVAQSQQKKKKKPRKRRTARKNKAKNRLFEPQKPPQKFLRRCLARSQNLGHSQKRKNNRVATARKLSVACPKAPSKVRALGARGLCGLQHNSKVPTSRELGRDCTPQQHTTWASQKITSPRHKE